MTKLPTAPDTPEAGKPPAENHETRGRERNGRFGTGNCANPQGRPRKDRSVAGTILNELNKKVALNRGPTSKKVTKLALNVTQLANTGAKGDQRSAKIAIDFALKAESQQAGVPKPAPLTTNDREIVERFLARLRATQEQSS